MSDMFPECNTFLAFDSPVAAAGRTSRRVRVDGANDLCIGVRLSAGTVADTVNIAVDCHAEATGVVDTAKTGIQHHYKLNGVPTLDVSDGKYVALKEADYVDSIDTLAADGDKEQMILIPIRERGVSAGLPWVDVTLTGGGARTAEFYFIRHSEYYAPGAEQASL